MYQQVSSSLGFILKEEESFPTAKTKDQKNEGISGAEYSNGEVVRYYCKLFILVPLAALTLLSLVTF
jgi:hypothetical protein